MKPSPLHHHLPDFAAPRPRETPDGPAILAPIGRQSAKQISAYEKGFMDGMEKTRTGYEALLAEQLRAFEARLNSERLQWAEAEAGKLSASLQHGLKEVETSVADAASRAIAPFVADGLEARALDDMAAALEQLLSGGRAACVDVRGAPDLLEKMRARLPNAPGVIFTPAETPEITASVDGAVIETDISALISRIQEITA